MAIDDNTSYELTGRQVKDLANKVKAKADSASLASVATSGLYSDLTGAPTIPTVNNGTLTIQQNGTTVGTFTANQSTNTTVSLTGGGSSYTAGNGISIDANDEISIDNTVVAEVSDIPTKTSDLQNDGSDGTSTYVEADDLATVATSGSYTDLTGVPTIPTVNDATLTIRQNGTDVGTFTANQSTNTTVSLTDTTYSAMTGATSGAAGASGLVPAPAAGDNDNILMGDGTWTALAQTVSNSNGSCIKFADGTMIATVKYTFTTVIDGAWGNCFESPCLTPPNFAAKFHSVPVCTASLFDVSAQCYIGMGSGKNSVTGSYAPTVNRPQKFVLSKPVTEPSRSYTVCFTAIGRWKA